MHFVLEAIKKVDVGIAEISIRGFVSLHQLGQQKWKVYFLGVGSL